MTTPGQDTYGRLLAALRPGLLRFALIQLRDQAQAEDIVQETLIKAQKSENRTSGSRKIRPQEVRKSNLWKFGNRNSRS